MGKHKASKGKQRKDSSAFKYTCPLEKHIISQGFSWASLTREFIFGKRTQQNMKFFIFAFILAIMAAMIGADSSEEACQEVLFALYSR
ncbi:statherin [Elephas maximus indicus]|uniref:statherin n=1 Tax=Elephas maximus indicus TaxID=99487 RepID=UPI002117096E|nr:statherin [Elephas maximus indicus]